MTTKPDSTSEQHSQNLDKTPDPKIGVPLLELIGGTPLVKLSNLFPEGTGAVYAKLEWMNPGGSIKDRLAAHLVSVAEKSGALQPGGTIIEPTSGNTGAGLAMIAAQRGYRCIFTCSDKVSEEKVALLRALGAEVIVSSSLLASSDPASYISTAVRLAKEIPGAWCPDQYHNPENPVAHELSTGPEVWEQTAGQITHLVASTGTGGTLTGTARALKQRNKGITIVAVDPEGSMYAGSNPAPYLVEGPGKDSLPPFWDPSLIDGYEIVSDAESFAYARLAARTEGILAGGSSGMVLAAAHRVAASNPDAVIVALLPDSGRAYLSKIYNDEWMARNGFEFNYKVGQGKLNSAIRVSDVPLQDLRAISPNDTGAQENLPSYSLPLSYNSKPTAPVEIIGSVAFDAEGVVQTGASLPFVGWFEEASTAYSRIREAGVGVVVRYGKLIGLVTAESLRITVEKQE